MNKFCFILVGFMVLTTGCVMGNQNDLGEEFTNNERDLTFQQVGYNNYTTNNHMTLDNATNDGREYTNNTNGQTRENKNQSLDNTANDLNERRMTERSIRRDVNYNSVQRVRYTDRYQFSEAASNKVTSMNQVERAFVTVQDDKAFVAIVPENHLKTDVSDHLERKIADMVKAMDIGVETVHVSDSQKLVEAMRDYAERTANTNSQQLLDEVAKEIKHTFPNE